MNQTFSYHNKKAFNDFTIDCDDKDHFHCEKHKLSNSCSFEC